MRRTEPRHVRDETSEGKAQEALAALIRNTRTTARALSLVDIENWLDIAVNQYGSVKSVADKIGLSAKMLRQFQAISKLSDSVQNMFARREIDSVDAAAYLSKLSKREQLVIAKKLASGSIDTSDLRAICDLRRRQPEMPLDAIVQNIKDTRNIRQYKIEFVVRGGTRELRSIQERFVDALGAEGIVSLSIDGSIGLLILNKLGARNLMTRCRALGMSKRRMVTRIAEGEGV